MSAAQLRELVQSQAEQIAALKHQLDWFRRQIFGSKSERFIAEPNPAQLHLGEALPVPQAPAAASADRQQTIAAHTRRVKARNAADAESGEELPFFDESKVPIQTIVLMPDTVEGLSPAQYEIIGEKVTYRLAQRPGSVQVLKYRRPVVKLKSNAAIHTVPAPVGIFEGSRADVSFAAGLLVDKFAWHLPLYRQHQRLEAAGIHVSRPWLTQIAQRSIQLLEPIHEAQFASIRQSRVKAMDETPIKAGRSGHGKMQTGYFWPVYGELDEVCFPFHPSRSHDYVSRALGLRQVPDSVLLSDGYAAYARYAEKTGLTHAQCWAHRSRRSPRWTRADRRALCRGGADPHARTARGGQATASADAQQADRRGLLPLDRPAAAPPGPHARQPIDQSARLCARAARRARSVPDRPRGAD